MLSSVSEKNSSILRLYLKCATYSGLFFQVKHRYMMIQVWLDVLNTTKQFVSCLPVGDIVQITSAIPNLTTFLKTEYYFPAKEWIKSNTFSHFRHV